MVYIVYEDYRRQQSPVFYREEYFVITKNKLKHRGDGYDEEYESQKGQKKKET